MKYLSIHEMSEKWNMKERKITALCRDERFPGTCKIGKEWMIPNDALKPIDKRTKKFEQQILEINQNKTTISYSISNSEEKVVNSFFQNMGLIQCIQPLLLIEYVL